MVSPWRPTEITTSSTPVRRSAAWPRSWARSGHPGRGARRPAPAHVGEHGLCPSAVVGVAGPAASWVVLVIAEVVGDLSIQRRTQAAAWSAAGAARPPRSAVLARLTNCSTSCSSRAVQTPLELRGLNVLHAGHHVGHQVHFHDRELHRSFCSARQQPLSIVALSALAAVVPGACGAGGSCDASGGDDASRGSNASGGSCGSQAFRGGEASAHFAVGFKRSCCLRVVVVFGVDRQSLVFFWGWG